MRGSTLIFLTAIGFLGAALLCGNPFLPCPDVAPKPASVGPSDAAAHEQQAPPARPDAETLRAEEATGAKGVLPVAALAVRLDPHEPGEVPDPDGVGPCPEAKAFVRRGIDGDGLATWWHADGSMTKRAVQVLRDAAGNELRVPVRVRVRPAGLAEQDR